MRSGVRCEWGAGHPGAHMGIGGHYTVGWPNTDATAAGASTQDGPALDGTGNQAERTADGSNRVSEGDRAAEAVQDLLSLPQREPSGLAQSIADGRRAAEEAALATAYRRGLAAASSPAIDRALSGTGWTYADVTTALRNLLEDSTPTDCAWLLEALDDYRPGRGPGRRRESTGGTDG